MINLGMVRPGSKVWVPVNTFDSNDPSASVTATTWLNTDCHVHKDGAVGQRASSAGETLSINFDTVTGNHLLEIDTADNTTANFYEAGSTYHVRVEGVTVDAGNINAWIGFFTIGYPNAILNTTIATLSTQQSFTLEDASLEADVYNGCPVIVHDLASAVQVAVGIISDYAVTTKTVTLLSDPGIFTMAAGDSISIFMPSNAFWFGTTAQAGDGTNLTETGGDGAQLTEAGGTGDHLTAINLPNQTMDIVGNITGNLSGSVGSLTGHTNQTADHTAGIADIPTVAEFNARTLVAASYFDPAADTVATVTTVTNQNTVAAIADGVWDEAVAGHVGAGTFGKTDADILADTNELQSDDVPGLIATAQADLDTITGTAGVLIGTDAANVTEIEDAVWDALLTGAAHNTATSAGRRLRQLNDSGLYEGGAVWYDDINGAAGSTDFENGTVNNPCSAEADVVTLLASLGLTTVHCASGSTYVMASTYSNTVFDGENWTLTLASQNIDGSTIIGASVSGICTSTSGTQTFRGCILGAITIPDDTHIIDCGIGGTITFGEPGDFFIDQCHSGIAGSGSPTLDWGTPATASNLSCRHHSGGWTIANMGAGAGTCTASFEGFGQLTWAASCAATSNASIRGKWKITDSASGAVTETHDDDRIDTAITELAQAQPSATPGIREAIMLGYMALRNLLKTQTSGTDALEIHNDAGTLIAKKLLTDDGSDYSEAKMTSGP